LKKAKERFEDAGGQIVAHADGTVGYLIPSNVSTARGYNAHAWCPSVPPQNRQPDHLQSCSNPVCASLAALLI
jgi:hypothetical protein